MNKLIISYSITPETYAGLKRLAMLANCSASSYLDWLVEKEINYRQLDLDTYDMLHPETETPAGE